MTRLIQYTFLLFSFSVLTGCVSDSSFTTNEGLVDRNYTFEEMPYYPEKNFTRSRLTDLFAGREAKVFVYKDEKADFSKIKKVYIAPVKIVSPASENLFGNRRLYKRILSNYEEGLKRELGKVVELVDAPGDDVATFRSVISSIQMEFSYLKIYQYVPVSMAIDMMKRTAGIHDKEIRAACEVRLDHKQLGEPMIMGAFTHIVGQAKDEKAVTADDVKDALDAWAEKIALRLKELMAGNSKL